MTSEELALWFNAAVRVDRFPIPIVLQAYPDQVAGEPIVGVRCVIVTGSGRRSDLPLRYALEQLLQAADPRRVLARLVFDDVAAIVQRELADCFLIETKAIGPASLGRLFPPETGTRGI